MRPDIYPNFRLGGSRSRRERWKDKIASSPYLPLWNYVVYEHARWKIEIVIRPHDTTLESLVVFDTPDLLFVYLQA